MGCLLEVDLERSRRAADPGLANRVREVKGFQNARFETTYADLLADESTAAAARFFLAELYGPNDFTRRDAQFARVVPSMVRLFPREVCNTVLALAQLHSLSERLDSEMAEAVPTRERAIGADVYRNAWRQVGRAPDRERQIALMLRVGTALIRHTKNSFLRHSLRLLRGPAAAAGFRELHSFLENGFDIFHALPQPVRFLEVVATRERAFAAALFEVAYRAR